MAIFPEYPAFSYDFLMLAYSNDQIVPFISLFMESSEKGDTLIRAVLNFSLKPLLGLLFEKNWITDCSQHLIHNATFLFAF